MTPRARRALFTVVLFFAVCAVTGSLLQRRVGAQSSEDESQLRDSLKSFTNVYALVEQNYAEPIAGDKADTAIYDGAIPGMLRTLDPHSNFYDPKAYAKMREEQHGRYYGVGMTIQQAFGGGKVFVVFPMEGGPAFKAGIHPADVISAIDGKSTDGMTSDQVAKILKGPKGTSVQVSMTREGQSKPLVFPLVRDEIPNPSVDIKYEIRPGIGYLHLKGFQETTAQEVIEAVDGFGDLKGLVFDLRDNPGGLLSQAVEVCDHLLAKGQTIVSQRGRAYPDQNYVAQRGNDGKTFPIVVLVSRGTASAAEIVSRRLAGPRPRPDRRRDHLRQRPRPDRLQPQRKHRPGPHHLPLLHAFRTPHPAQLRRRLALRLLLQPCRSPASEQDQPGSQADRLPDAPSTAAAASRPTKRLNRPRPTTSRKLSFIRMSSSTLRRSISPIAPWTRTSRWTKLCSPSSSSS